LRRIALLIGLLCVVSGCGSTKLVQEPSITVSGDSRPASPGGADDGQVRIAVVTHGQASSPFWVIVRNGVDAAERQMNVQVDYEAPDVYSLQRMIGLIDAAVATKPDGLVVSLPEPGLAPGRRVARAGVRRALCVNQQVGNQGLDARCAGLARAMRAVHGGSHVLGIDDQSTATARTIGAEVVAGSYDGVLATNATGGLEAVQGVAAVRRRGG
jgi:simple sugar transport system substrate-binding protein